MIKITKNAPKTVDDKKDIVSGWPFLAFERIWEGSIYIDKIGVLSYFGLNILSPFLS